MGIASCNAYLFTFPRGAMRHEMKRRISRSMMTKSLEQNILQSKINHGETDIWAADKKNTGPFLKTVLNAGGQRDCRQKCQESRPSAWFALKQTASFVVFTSVRLVYFDVLVNICML